MVDKLKEAIQSPVADLMVRLFVLFVAPWSIWVTVQIFEGQGNFKVSDALLMELRIKELIGNLPPAEWRNKVDRLEDKVHAIELDTARNSIKLGE